MAERPIDSEKGILHPRTQARHRELNRLAPGPVTSRYVEWYWTVRWDLIGRPAYVAEVLPYPSVNVTFETEDGRAGGYVTGVLTKTYRRELTGRGRVFGIKFWPGGFGAFTGRDVGALRDREVPLAEVFDDAGRLTDLVLAEDSDERRRAVVEAYLADRIVGRPEDPSYELVLRIVRAMAAERGLTRVDQLTERFDLGIRTMQRLFRRYVGAGPKWVLRRYRLQDGAHLLAQGDDAELARLAADLGYFDQAHFSHDFKAQTGLTPAEYAAAQTSAEEQSRV